MMDSFMQLNPVMQAFLATLFTWGVTAAGAALVFMKKDVNPKVLDMMLGFAAGVMIAASFWSLLNPGIEMAEQMGQTPWLTAVIGFMRRHRGRFRQRTARRGLRSRIRALCLTDARRRVALGDDRWSDCPGHRHWYPKLP